MLNKIINRLLVVSATLLYGTILFAQSGASTGYTPFSIYGIGELTKEGTAYNKTMGGVGVAGRNNRFINYLNPAAVTARDTLSFMADFGLSSSNKILSQNGIKSANNTFNMADFIISFPVYRKSAMYFGLTPYTSVKYAFATDYSDPLLVGTTGSINYSAIGNGGLNHLFYGAGVKLFDKVSVGAQLSYYFGNIEKSTNLSFANSSYRSVFNGSNISISSLTGKFGIQYETNVGNNSSIGVGATYKLGSKVKGYSENYSYASIGTVTDTLSYKTDTLHIMADRIMIPGEIAVGVSYKYRDKFMAEVDFISSNWASSNFDKVDGFSNIGANTTFSSTSSQSIRGGFEYTPNRNDIRYFYKRITYRGGAYYDKEYYMLNNSPVRTVAITLGATIPIYRWYNGLTVGMELGQRGFQSDQMIRERFVNFSISLNIFDIWFQKVRYD